MTKKELAKIVATHMHEVRTTVNIEKTADLLSRKMKTYELEIIVKKYSK